MNTASPGASKQATTASRNQVLTVGLVTVLPDEPGRVCATWFGSVVTLIVTKKYLITVTEILTDRFYSVINRKKSVIEKFTKYN